MLPAGFKKRHIKKGDKNPNQSLSSGAVLFMGMFVLITSLIYMIVNFPHADLFVVVWLPFMISGVLLVFLSHLIKNIRH